MSRRPSRHEQDEAVRLTGEALYRTYWQAAVANSTDWPTKGWPLSRSVMPIGVSTPAAMAERPPRRISDCVAIAAAGRFAHPAPQGGNE